jgi:DNA polymerase-3 subunit epsilon
MLRHLRLSRQLAVIDLETTGTDPKTDRIVEISVLKIHPNGAQSHRTRRLNPEMPIPEAATAIHGITDADVANQPTFARIAKSLLDHLECCDLCGYNLKKFDLRVLHAEFQRAKRTFSLEGRAIIDPFEIFCRMEPRNLGAAVRRYLGCEHDGAHSAEGDVLATAAVLDAMLGRHSELPRTIAELNAEFQDSDSVDPDGFFRRVEGEIRLMKGKHRGEPLDEVAEMDPEYLEWMLSTDFFEDTKEVAREGLATWGSVAGKPDGEPSS